MEWCGKTLVTDLGGSANTPSSVRAYRAMSSSRMWNFPPTTALLLIVCQMLFKPPERTEGQYRLSFQCLPLAPRPTLWVTDFFMFQRLLFPVFNISHFHMRCFSCSPFVGLISPTNSLKVSKVFSCSSNEFMQGKRKNKTKT